MSETQELEKKIKKLQETIEMLLKMLETEKTLTPQQVSKLKWYLP